MYTHTPHAAAYAAKARALAAVPASVLGDGPER
jgi:hypothetical protein